MSLMYLSLGSNLNDRHANLQQAIAQLGEHFTITAISPVYATEPWGDADQPPFLNVCVAAATTTPPHDVLRIVKDIETAMGRQPTRRWGPRLIDIDILFYDKLVLADKELTIPHPRMDERAFVLAPLADIIPTFRHPQTGETVEEMLGRVDVSGVERLFEMQFPNKARDVALSQSQASA
ncbi:MAG TPA: 2-amino-4-hydroxy-6-hydroxymethyldihydropteridine diphosphokinase [Promineifilum sp.]|nr:2-amino-4-hydroxy-6-hydroxymethyldihydropteridine diphosphokinase [Promineifilum sp.]